MRAMREKAEERGREPERTTKGKVKRQRGQRRERQGRTERISGGKVFQIVTTHNCRCAFQWTISLTTILHRERVCMCFVNTIIIIILCIHL